MMNSGREVWKGTTEDVQSKEDMLQLVFCRTRNKDGSAEQRDDKVCQKKIFLIKRKNNSTFNNIKCFLMGNTKF